MSRILLFCNYFVTFIKPKILSNLPLQIAKCMIQSFLLLDEKVIFNMEKSLKTSRKDALINMFMLHGGFVILSLAIVAQKFAGESDTLSLRFIIFLGLAIFLLGIYSIVWQLTLRRVSLASAFSHRGVLVIWGFFWGMVLFNEQITLGQIIAACFILVGILIIGKVDSEKRDEINENIDIKSQSEVADNG